MTTGNVSRAKRRPSADTRERFIEATLDLIAEEGGSLGVNLRAVSRRVGCAHTNAYNYFDSYGDLLWTAFRRALSIYGDHLLDGLDRSLPADRYLRLTIENLAAFPQHNPGLYRFIGSDPIDPETIPADVMDTVAAMKRWFAEVVGAAVGPRVGPEEAREVADIVLAYVDGETLNLINGRAIAGEDLGARVVANALRLFELLAADTSTGHPRPGPGQPPEPASIFGIAETPSNRG